MSTIIFVAENLPEKKLTKTLRYKAYLSPEEKEKIMKELIISVPDLEDYIVTMHVEIDLKLYDTKTTRV